MSSTGTASTRKQQRGEQQHTSVQHRPLPLHCAAPALFVAVASLLVWSPDNDKQLHARICSTKLVARIAEAQQDSTQARDYEWLTQGMESLRTARQVRAAALHVAVRFSVIQWQRAALL